MDPRNLNDLNAIEDQLLVMRKILRADDVYYVCDTIVNNFSDELLSELIEAMLKNMGYRPSIRKKVDLIIKKIQK